MNSSTQTILVLGAGGMLGREVSDVVSGQGHAVDAATRTEVDVRHTAQIARRMAGVGAVINCAAFTDVDGCESAEGEATEINGEAVGALAAVCAERRCRFVHVSTDYVFAGDAKSPYSEEDPIDPQSAYGRSKARGERLALQHGGHIVRTSWLFGPTGPNFVETMLSLADRGQAIRVVDDQVGCPTYTRDLALALVRIATAAEVPPQRFHFANPPSTSWFGFAQQIFRVFDRAVDITPCATEEFPRPAPRPAYSVLDSSRYASWSGTSIPSWQEALVDYRHRRAGGGTDADPEGSR